MFSCKELANLAADRPCEMFDVGRDDQPFNDILRVIGLAVQITEPNYFDCTGTPFCRGSEFDLQKHIGVFELYFRKLPIAHIGVDEMVGGIQFAIVDVHGS